MKLRWIIPIAVLIPLRISATDTPVGARVATITINPQRGDGPSSAAGV